MNNFRGYPANPRWGDKWGGKAIVGKLIRTGRLRPRMLVADETGMSTVEYAIGTIAAAAFGAILYTAVTEDSIVSALTNIITRALNPMSS